VVVPNERDERLSFWRDGSELFQYFGSKRRKFFGLNDVSEIHHQPKLSNRLCSGWNIFDDNAPPQITKRRLVELLSTLP
jgi:hypothetical protein